MSIINLFNGDCAWAAWRQSGLPGTALVWRENYLQGELPATTDREEFHRRRAIALHRLAPEKSEAAIFAELTEMNRQLRSLTAEDTLILWFDFCPFDRTMLARILFLLDAEAVAAQLRLIAKDVTWSTENFLQYQHGGVLLSPAMVRRGAAQWRAYENGAPPETLLSEYL